MSFAQGMNAPVGTGASVLNISIATTGTMVIPASGSNLNWCIYPEGTGAKIRCVPVIPNITNPPSSSNGFQIVNTNPPFCTPPGTPPTLEVDCVGLGGAIPASAWISTK